MCNSFKMCNWSTMCFLFLCAFRAGGLLAQPSDTNTVNAAENQTNLATFAAEQATDNNNNNNNSTSNYNYNSYVDGDNFEAAPLTKAEFEFYAKSLSLVRSENCRRDLNATLWGIVNGAPWATAMYDATVKSAVGIESAVLHQFGHYDQCLGQHRFSDQLGVRAQYCLIGVHVEGLNVHDLSSRAMQQPQSTDKQKQQRHLGSILAYWGACVPESCDASDVAIHMGAWLQRNVSQEEAPICQVPAEFAQLHVSSGMFIYACIMCFFVLLAVLSTMHHVHLLLWSPSSAPGKEAAPSRNPMLTTVLLSFSIIENTKKLFQPSKDQLGLNSINGIKALAMLLILAGHALSFILGGPMYNAKFINEQLQLPTFSFLTNSLLFVDTFLLLSGFLFCRILLIELERRRGKLNVVILYVARFIRLTPAYMAVIGFYMTWFPHVGSGPIWPQRIGLEQERCQSSWWLNVLYINNYFNTDQLCMFQSWYLSVDSQLFFVAPIVIFVLYRSRVLGLRFLYALVALTAGIPFVVTYLEQLDPTLMIYADEVKDLARNDFYIKSYIKTHMRASAYIIGLLVGYLVHLIQEKSIELPPRLVRCVWLFAVFIGMGSMYGVTRFYVAPYTLLESSLYAGFHKLGWNLAVGWLVLAATTGHAGWLQRALGSRFFAPISRLTYCAYLSNGIVELYHMSSIRSPSYMGYLSLTNDVFSHTLDTFLLAIIVCLLFESPIHALERIMLRNFGGKDQSHGHGSGAGKTRKETPSTSEEQMA